MEGGGNMKREGEGHREIERVSKERERRGERVVSEFSIGEKKSRGKKGKVRAHPFFPFCPRQEKKTAEKESEKMG